MNDSVFVAVGLGRCGGVKEGLTGLLIFEYILKGVTLWSGCTGQTALAGFLGQRPKWDGATPSPSGEPTTL